MINRANDLLFSQVAVLLRRRWKLITAVTLLGGVAAGALGFLLPPTYTAKVQLLYDADKRDNVEVVDDSAIETLAQLMVSPGHLRRIEASLAESYPEQEDSSESAAESAVTAVRPPDFEELELNLDAYKGHGSRLISVTFRSEDPEMAATVANRAVDLYFKLETDWRSKGRDATLEGVQKGILSTRVELDRAEIELREIRRAYGAVSFGAADQIDIQIADLNRQRNITQSVLERNRQALDALVTSRGKLDIPAAPRSRGDIQSENAVAVRARTDIAGSLADKLVALGDFNALLQPTVDTSEEQRRLALEIEAGQAQLRAIDEQLQTLRQAGAEVDKGLANVENLERIVKSTSQTYQALLSRQADLMGQSVDRLPVRVVSVASVPIKQNSPHPLLFILPALVVSGLLGSALAIVLEKMDQRLRGVRDVEEALGVPCIGLVPKARKKRGLVRLDTLRSEPFSPYTEAIRSMVVSALNVGRTNEPSSLLVTSNADGEGKTTLALSLAIYAAQLGRRVILVDLDLRNSGLMHAMGRSASEGTTDFLDGNLSGNIQRSTEHGIDYLALPSGMVVDPLALLTGKRVQSLLSTLGQTYDFIVVDSAPAGIAVETRIVASMVDRVIFAVRWGVTEAPGARAAVQFLRAAAPGRIEAAITQVNLRRHKRYRYGELAPTLKGPAGVTA